MRIRSSEQRCAFLRSVVIQWMLVDVVVVVVVVTVVVVGFIIVDAFGK